MDFGSNTTHSYRDPYKILIGMVEMYRNASTSDDSFCFCMIWTIVTDDFVRCLVTVFVRNAKHASVLCLTLPHRIAIGNLDGDKLRL